MSKTEKPKPAATAPTPVEVDQTDHLLALIERMGESVTQTADDVSMGIIERLMRADSVEALLAPQGTTQAKEILGQPIVIRDVKFLESTIEGDGPPVYAVLDCMVDGEPTAVTCGARTVMAQALKAKSAGWLPMECVIEQSPQRTKSGYYPMYLAPYVASNGTDARAADEESF